MVLIKGSMQNHTTEYIPFRKHDKWNPFGKAIVHQSKNWTTQVTSKGTSTLMEPARRVISHARFLLTFYHCLQIFHNTAFICSTCKKTTFIALHYLENLEPFIILHLFSWWFYLQPSQYKRNLQLVPCVSLSERVPHRTSWTSKEFWTKSPWGTFFYATAHPWRKILLKK